MCMGKNALCYFVLLIARLRLVLRKYLRAGWGRGNEAEEYFMINKQFEQKQ